MVARRAGEWGGNQAPGLQAQGRRRPNHARNGIAVGSRIPHHPPLAHPPLAHLKLGLDQQEQIPGGFGP